MNIDHKLNKYRTCKKMYPLSLFASLLILIVSLAIYFDFKTIGV